MSITSFYYFVFLGFSLVAYYSLPLKIRWSALLVASGFFFYEASPHKTIAFLMYGVIVSYLGARWIDREHDDTKRLKKCIITVVATLMTLICFNYMNLVVNITNSFTDLFSIHWKAKRINVVLPLGVSFYTFTLLSYVIDVQRRLVVAQTNFFKHMTFAIFFPPIVSGPLMRYGDIKSNLLDGNKFDYQTFCFGLQRIFWGLFKKLVIAERLIIVVNKVFDSGEYKGFYMFVAMIFFAIQLYCDFSGCMDIAIGSAQAFGVKLPENFETPFFSKSIAEFFRRWHITLGLWFKDYVFYPIFKTNLLQKNFKHYCKNKWGKKWANLLPMWCALICCWFTLGIWHGDQYKYFVCSAMLPCSYIILSDAFLELRQRVVKILNIKTDCFSWNLFLALKNFVLVCAIFFVFRVPDLHSLGKYFRRFFKEYNPWIFFDGSLYKLGLDMSNFMAVLVAMFVLLVVEILHQKGSVREQVANQNLVFRWIVYIGLIFSVLIFGMYGPEFVASKFIYANF